MKIKLTIGCSVVLFLLSALSATTFAQRRGMMLGTLKPTAELQQDVRNLATLGAKILRFPIYYSYDPSVDVWLAKADVILAECEARQIVLVIDFHHPTPGVIGSEIRDVNDFVNRWRLFAGRFRNRGHFWYDLCNEPNHPQWRDVALLAARAIREIDQTHSIIFSPRGTTTSSADTITPLQGITKQVLQFHFYNWTDVQMHPQPPGDNLVVPYPSTNRTKENLRQLLDQVRLAGVRTGLPVYIGEVAISRHHPNAPRFLRDFSDICDEMGINLTIHAYREADIWNYELNANAWTQITNWLAR